MTIKPCEMLIETLNPGIFEKGDDVQAFIIKWIRYFEESKIHILMKNLLVIQLISKELQDKYKSTDKTGIKGYKNQMWLAFTKQQRIMTKALSYKGTKKMRTITWEK